MKKNELEQTVEESRFRISKLEQRLSEMMDRLDGIENLISELKNNCGASNLGGEIGCDDIENIAIEKINLFSKEIYTYTDEQNLKIMKRVDSLEESCLSRTELSNFSKDLYSYIDQQDLKGVSHTDNTRDDLACRIQNLSDGIYEHVSKYIDQFEIDINKLKGK